MTSREGFSQEARFRGMRVQEGSVGCIDSGSVGDILRSVWVGFEVIVWWF